MDYIAQFGRYMEAERRASAATVATYLHDLREFEQYMSEGEDSPAVFDPKTAGHSHLRAWVISLSEKKMAPGSVNRKITAVRSFYRYLLREGVVEKNPAGRIRKLKTGRKLPHFVDQRRMEDLARVLEEPSQEYGIERDATVVLMLYACGLRRSELAGLEVDDVDLGRKTVRVFGKGAKERMVPLLPEMAVRLEHYLQIRNQENICEGAGNSLFLTNKGRQLTDQGVYGIVKHYLTVAGVQGKSSPHVLRHTFATHLMQHGVSVRTVQQLLGHQSLAATQIYTHNTIESLKETYRKTHPRAIKK